jgi:Mg-chelatase subunit ChlI
MADDDALPSAIDVGVPPASAAAVATRTSRRNKRPAGSSLANEDDERQLTMDTLRRRHRNSPPKSNYNSPTPRPLSTQRSSYAAAVSKVPTVSLSFNTDGASHDGSDGSEYSPSKDNDNGNIDNESESDASFISGDCLDAEDEWNDTAHPATITTDAIYSTEGGTTD